MNCVVHRWRSCAAASLMGVAGLLLLIGCATRPAPQPSPNTSASSSNGDLNVIIARGSPNGVANESSTALQVDVQIFAAKGQNPVTLIYTVTNALRNEAILAPIYVVASTEPHIKVIDSKPISGTAVVKSLKPGESATGSITLQIEPWEWQEIVEVNATTNLARLSPEDIEARNQGGVAWAYGGGRATFRVKDGRIEASQFGWGESVDPGFTTLDDGTRVPRPTFNPNLVFPTLTPNPKSTDVAPPADGTKTP